MSMPNSSNHFRIRSRGHSDYYSMYKSGFYVNSNSNGFFWDHEDSRHIIRLTEKTIRKARSLLKECPLSCTYSVSLRSSELLDLLQREKPDGWLTPFVRSIYEDLLRYRKAFTFEAVYDGEVVGGVFGVPVGKILTLDTFVGSSASEARKSTAKSSLCELLILANECGITIVDVELKHKPDHPAARLGEESINFEDFRGMLESHSHSGSAFIDDAVERQNY